MNRPRQTTFSPVCFSSLAFLLVATGARRWSRFGHRPLNGKPLEFGTVIFQPPSGQPAQGDSN